MPGVPGFFMLRGCPARPPGRGGSALVSAGSLIRSCCGQRFSAHARCQSRIERNARLRAEGLRWCSPVAL